MGSYAITQGSLAASANYTLTYIGANLSVTAVPTIVVAPTATPVFPSDFLDEFNGNGFASATFVAEDDKSTCTSADIVRSLNRTGRVDLTGANAPACKGSLWQIR